MKINIRKEKQSDFSLIRNVTELAFKNAVHSSHTEHWIVEALRKNNRLTLSLVAEINGNIVGHVAISPVTISDGANNWYGLGPISVIPEYQNMGIGSLLMKEALLELRTANAGGCVVLGDPNYYGKFGFKVYSGLIYPNVPPEYFQVLPFDESIPTGEVDYDEAFNATE